MSLIFECKACGECCKGFGGTYVTDEDIKKIAAYIKENPKTFAKKYCQKSGSRYVLAQGKDGYCLFLKDNLCSIHPVKPRMCRAWPYLESVLKDKNNWQIMGASCKGINRDAPYSEVAACIKKEIEKLNNSEDLKGE